MKTIFYTLLLGLALPILGISQNKNGVEDFVLKDVLSNDDFTLSSFSNTKGIAVIFTSTECPFAVRYDDRIRKLIDTYSERGISFLLINANFGDSGTAESLDKMKLHARIFGVPYLVDMAQDAQRKFGARKSPEAFLLKPSNGKFSVFYQGAIDDNPQVARDVNTKFLENAITQFLKNQSANPSYRNPAGCIIKKI